MIQSVGGSCRWHMVPNGVDLSIYSFVESVGDDAPLVFLGRIEEVKGPHLAIEIAKRTGRRLVIAGNIPVDHQGWASANVLSHVDGKQISYVGPLDDAGKNALLGQARAFLMPILWEEPFGIVMAEALACGTPVIGLKRGAVPEVIIEGETGFVCDALEDMVNAVGMVDRLSRTKCRTDAESRFSAEQIVLAYEAIYREAASRKLVMQSK
jgi:glycosyltransferase involved in cell wall biosynthesis